MESMEQIVDTSIDPATCALALADVTKDFGALRAVNRVSMRVAPGERRAVIGPNGAGKTTLFNLITGELSLTDGKVYLFGKNISSLPAHQRVDRGIGRTFQITNLFPALSVEENVLLAAQGVKPVKLNPVGRIRHSGQIHDRAMQALEDTGLSEVRGIPINELSHGEQRQLEVALALALEPKVLMLDEPAAGLSTAERTMMADLISSLPDDLTIVLIEHDMDLALGLVDRVTCLHYGKVIADDTPRCVSDNGEVQECYLGARYA